MRSFGAMIAEEVHVAGSPFLLSCVVLPLQRSAGATSRHVVSAALVSDILASLLRSPALAL